MLCKCSGKYVDIYFILKITYYIFVFIALLYLLIDHIFQGTPDMPRCGFSNAVAQIMRMHGVDYDSHNVLADEKVRQGMPLSLSLEMYLSFPLASYSFFFFFFFYEGFVINLWPCFWQTVYCISSVIV